MTAISGPEKRLATSRVKAAIGAAAMLPLLVALAWTKAPAQQAPVPAAPHSAQVKEDTKQAEKAADRADKAAAEVAGRAARSQPARAPGRAATLSTKRCGVAELSH